jgi:hypothetical protein
MKLREVKLTDGDGLVRLVGVFEFAGEVREVWFEYGGHWRDFVRADADVFVPLGVAAALYRREHFETELPVSARMTAQIRAVQSMMTAWFPDALARFEPALPNVVAKPPAEASGVGTCFSAGVDSYYVVMKDALGEGVYPQRTTHLIYIRGVEAPLSKIDAGKADRLAEIAEHLGLPLIIGRTNLRDVFDYAYLPYVCGPALSAAGLSLSRGLSAFKLPAGASFRYEELTPESTHHMLDRRWSTEYLEVLHDGGDATRPEKVAFVADDPYALANLSVCIRNLGEWDNCGKCPKCIRTMTTLQALGVLERAPGFPSPFDYSLIRRMNLDGPIERAYLVHNLEFALRSERDPRLTRALERHLARWERYRALVTLVKGTPLHPLARLLKGLVKGRRR